ncbi:hypothetical protein [Hyphomicrobium sp.]|jgi:hypothetical protein|uniref:hypothetical protein n=1 Tax=Hyphomicrobium sp. TaxID=82 RepID=UPI002FE3F427
MTQFFRRIIRPLLAGRALSDAPDAGADLAPDTRAAQSRQRAHRLHAPALDRVEL